MEFTHKLNAPISGYTATNKPLKPSVDKDSGTLSEQVVQSNEANPTEQPATELEAQEYLDQLEAARLDARRTVPAIPLNIDAYSKTDLLALHKALKGFDSPNARYNTANLKEIGVQVKVLEQIIRKNYPDVVKEAGISLNEGDVPAGEFVKSLKDFLKSGANKSQPLPAPPQNLDTYGDQEVEGVAEAYKAVFDASNDKMLKANALRYMDKARSEIHRRLGVPMKQPSFIFNPMQMSLVDFDKLLKSQQEDVDLYKTKGFKTLYAIEQKSLEHVRSFRQQRADGTLDLRVGAGQKPKPTLPEEADRIIFFAKRHEKTGQPYPKDGSGQPMVPIHGQLLPYPSGAKNSDLERLRSQQEEADKTPSQQNVTALAEEQQNPAEPSTGSGVINLSDSQGNPVNDEALNAVTLGNVAGGNQFLASK
jgi:hypothetical protein